jgi:Protein of unknown function (DUF3429)
MHKTSTAIPAAPFWLGSLGLLPFIGSALLYLFAHTPEQRQLALQVFANYSAVILSFLGGIRWGAALPLPSFRLLLRAVLPSLVGAGCLLLAPLDAVPLLAVTFFIVGWTDCRRTSHALWPFWFKRLRLMLSVAVVSMHTIMVAATRGWFA